MSTISLLLVSTATFSADHLDLEVVKIKKNNPSHVDFCRRHPGECDMSRPQILELSEEVSSLLNQVNTEVNAEIQFILDPDQYQKEEFWNYPISGAGDCEDNALEKKKKVSGEGLTKRCSQNDHRIPPGTILCPCPTFS